MESKGRVFGAVAQFKLMEVSTKVSGTKDAGILYLMAGCFGPELVAT